MSSVREKKEGESVLQLLRQCTKHDLLSLVHQLLQRRKVNLGDLRLLLDERGVMIPCSIFSPRLSAFETICKYLKEEKGMRYHEIAVLLGRDDRTIWTVYHKAVSQQKKRLSFKKGGPWVPASLFQNRTFSILEHLVTFLKEEYGMRYHEIAVLLGRDDRTIWTVYHRNLRKRGAS